MRTTKAEYAPGDRDARVALLSGARKHESRRRSMNQGTDGYRRRNSQVWINPLNHWLDSDMDAYRREHSIPESDVAALLHRSGECNCAAYMSVGEIEEVLSLFPDWHRETIEPLQDACREIGIPRCIWGERTDTGRPGAKGWPLKDLALTADQMTLDDEAELCSTCGSRFDDALALR